MSRFVGAASVAVVLSFAAAAAARGEAADGLRQFVETQYPSLESLYTSIHRNPELSEQEEKTSALLASELFQTRRLFLHLQVEQA